MKNAVKKAAVFFMRCLYAVLKLRPQKKRIVFLSRESDSPPLDFLLLENEIKKELPDYETVMLCRLLPSGNVNVPATVLNTFQSMLLLSNARACVIDTFSLPVSVLKQRKNFKAVQIWHALGGLKCSGYASLDKPAGHSSQDARILCMHKNYSLVCAPSEAVKDIYKQAFNCDESIILKLGMPRIDYILGESEEKKNRAALLKEKYPQLVNGKKNILYAPTFRKNKAPDIKHILSAVDTNKYNLLLKAHIIAGQGLIPDTVTVVNETIFDIFEFSDYIITDYSAASVEAALTGKKLFFYVWDIDDYKENPGLFIDPLEEYPTLSSKNFEDIYKMIETDDYDTAALAAFKNRMVETADTGNSKRIAQKIREILQ